MADSIEETLRTTLSETKRRLRTAEQDRDDRDRELGELRVSYGRQGTELIEVRRERDLAQGTADRYESAAQQYETLKPQYDTLVAREQTRGLYIPLPKFLRKINKPLLAVGLAAMLIAGTAYATKDKWFPKAEQTYHSLVQQVKKYTPLK